MISCVGLGLTSTWGVFTQTAIMDKKKKTIFSNNWLTLKTTSWWRSKKKIIIIVVTSKTLWINVSAKQYLHIFIVFLHKLGLMFINRYPKDIFTHKKNNNIMMAVRKECHDIPMIKRKIFTPIWNMCLFLKKIVNLFESFSPICKVILKYPVIVWSKIKMWV